MQRVIPEINTDTFLKFTGFYARKFIAQKGFGKWLAEYQQMEVLGQFEPKVLRSMYVAILQNKFTQSFIIKQAVYYICSQAQDATIIAEMKEEEKRSKLYAVFNTLTLCVAQDEDNEDLVDLEKDEANMICEAMNEEALDEIYKVIKMIDL